MPNQNAPFHRWWIWAIYLILLLIGVPWYWDSDNTTIFFGLPGWMMIAIITSIAVSCFTSFLWFNLWQPDEEEENQHG